MKKFFEFVFVLFCVIGLTGCISTRYDGENGGTPSPERIDIFNRDSEVPRPHRDLGTAEVSGNYNDVSRDRMVEKILDMARDHQADAVVVVSQQVIRDSNHAAVSQRSFDYDDNTASWNHIRRDVDRDYGNVRGKGDPTEVENPLYVRVIKAKFIKYTSGNPVK